MSRLRTSFAIVSCTKKEHMTDTLLYESLQRLRKDNDDMYCVFDYTYFFCKNKKGLSECYNDFIERHGNDFNYIVFAHDDVFIDDGNITDKLVEAHKHFDIVGVAGGINPVVKEPALWHLMCGGFGPNLRGFAGHYTQDNRIMITSFGPTPSRVAIADGVFLSIDTKKIKDAGWKFNENYTFHHYDISSCLDANKLKLKVGVAPILLYHKSPGLLNPHDPVFLESQAKFVKEYGSY